MGGKPKRAKTPGASGRLTGDRMPGDSASSALANEQAYEEERKRAEALADGAADITEEGLRRSEERYRSLVSVITNVPWTTDAEGRFITPQLAWAAYTGQSWDEARDFGWANALHPDDRENIWGAWRRACETGSLYESQGRLWHARSRQYRYFVARAAPLLNLDGSVREWVGAYTDVHDQKVAEELVRESEARYRATFDNAAIGIAHVGLDGRWLRFNDAVCAITGYSREELVTKSFPDITHPGDIDADWAQARQVLTGEIPTYSMEKRYFHKDGSIVWVRLTVSLIRDAAGAPQNFISIIEDISERKRAEEALREFQARRLAEERRNAERLRELNAADVKINAAASVDEITHLITEKARELTGARMSAINLVHGADWKRSRTIASLSDEYAAWRDYDAQVTGEGIYSLVARRKQTMRLTQAELEAHPAWRGHGREAGRHPPLRGWLAAPLLDRGGECVGVLQLSDKWTMGKADEFTEADEALLQQLAQVASVALEKQQLYEQEQEARQMAEQATRAKDEFLAVVSHELRSPLNAILGWNRLLRAQRGDDPQIARVAETVESSGKAQLRLIEDLLDTARIVSGKMRLETQPVDLVAVIASALDTVRPAADSKGIVIVPNFSPEAGQTSYQIIGDADRLQQVVWNLVSNAIKFTPEGGRVWVELRRGGPSVQIIVRDTGQGIGPDLLPYVFDRFKQGGSSVSRRFGGLGLGLALVKHLVELHGGSVMVESPGEGQGATFTVSLPAPAVKGDSWIEGRREGETAVDRRASSSLQPVRLEGVRALVVEDQAGARELITLTLEQHGALVTGVDSADAALAALESQLEDGAACAPFDVLISDIEMPGADGYELIRRVRDHRDERVSRIRAVALTAYARTEDRLRALQAGFHMHVPKPVDEAELTMVIASLTGRILGEA